MTDNDVFRDSFSRSNVYPRNLVYHNTYNHILEAHADRLDKQAERLFHNEETTDVELWEYKDHASGFVSHRSASHVDLQNHLVGAQLFVQIDPKCRFVFIHAGHSRDRLKITKAMLTTVLTYYQAMAQFVDFLFSFGKQDYPRDFHFSGVYHETRLTNYQPRLKLPDLGRSGEDIQLCYNLKSVELSSGQPLIPWSVRICAVYHRFDVTTGKAFWTVIKGDDLITRRIKTATGPGHKSSPELSSPCRTFSLTLDVHLIIFDWCREKWRWYISYLEDLQDATTRRAITTSFDRPAGQITDTSIPTAPTPPGKMKRTLTHLSQRVASGIGTLSPPPPQAPSPHPTPPPPDYEPDLRNTEIFSISDLQNLTSWEEKIKELLLVIRSNIKIVTDVKRYYMDLTSSPEFPDDIKTGSMTKLKDFQVTVTSIVNDLEMQYSRADMLLSTLTNRKGLLNGILDYRNMEASKSFAEKAEASTREMQSMTEEMKELTQKTKQETVSMRIITLVTLFFLPGTYISTIMSTDILQYSKIDGSNKFEENYSSEALKRYVEITVPLMAITFAAWYFVYLWVDKRQDVKALKRKYMEKWSSDRKV